MIPEKALQWRAAWEAKEVRADLARALRDVERLKSEIEGGKDTPEKRKRLERAVREVEEYQGEVEQLNVR